jgi:hypothetical protein
MYFQSKIKFILEHTMKAQRVSGEGVWYCSTLFFNLGATPRALYPEKNPVSTVQKIGWVLGPVWTGT